MSNKRQDEDREVALHAYILEHHPDYAGWLKRRNAHHRNDALDRPCPSFGVH